MVLISQDLTCSFCSVGNPFVIAVYALKNEHNRGKGGYPYFSVIYILKRFLFFCDRIEKIHLYYIAFYLFFFRLFFFFCKIECSVSIGH